MKVTEEHIRHIMLFEYQQGKTATTAVQKIEEVYGVGVLSVRKCQQWFCKFRQGDSACKMPQPRPTKIHATKISTETRFSSSQSAVRCLLGHVWCHTL